MAVDQGEIYFTHTLDILWIIALWHAIHGGDPPRGEQADTAELIARGLVGHLSGAKVEAPKNVIEKMTKLGMKVIVKLEDQSTEVKSTNDFHAVIARRKGLIPIFCVMLADGVEFCWAGRFIPPFLTTIKVA